MGYQELLSDISQIAIIDTHEHLWDEHDRIAMQDDWAIFYNQYARVSLRSVGMTDDEYHLWQAPSTPHDEKWQIFSHYYPLCKDAEYVRILDLTAKQVYGIASMNSQSMMDLTQAIQSKKQSGFYDELLQKANINICMVNSFDVDDNGVHLPLRISHHKRLMADLCVDDLVMMNSRPWVEVQTGLPTQSLSDYKAAIDTLIQKFAPQICSGKTALSYIRPLSFDAVHASACQLDFQDVLSGKKIRPHSPLIDHLFLHVAQRLSDFGIPIKFHTGIRAGDGYGDTGELELNIRHLSGLAMRYPHFKIIALHCGWPMMDETLMAGKQIPNFYPDMSVLFSVDPQGACDFLRRAIPTMSSGKIFAFGGDYALIEPACVQAIEARKKIVAVLHDLVNQGYFTHADAVDSARLILRENAIRIYPNIKG